MPNPKTLYISCLRGGTNNINHKFYFDNQEDCIEISHTVKDRISFVNGIIKSINFLKSKKSGFFEFNDLFQTIKEKT
jgi:dihydrodipicolinate reductase